MGLAITASIYFTGCAAHNSADIASITFTSTDGVTIYARLYYPMQQDTATMPPGLILLHRAGASHEVWQSFTHRARQTGYMLLALDLRGHGDSTSPPEYPNNHRDYNSTHWLACLDDFSQAREILISHGANPDNIGVIGEGLGANLGLHWYYREQRLHALVALSPGLEYQGIQTESVARELTQRPVLYLASDKDNYAVRSATSLRDMTPGFAELRTFSGFAHGTDLFVTSPNAMEITLQWLDGILKQDAGHSGSS